MGSAILFHIGLHKTATSSLQQDFFIPDNGFIPNGGREWLLPMFVDKFSTASVTDREKQDLQNFIDSASSQGLVPVASHERLSGYPFSGGYDRLSILNRIKGSGVDAKILLIIREQKSWLYSAWKQIISDMGAIGLEEFLRPHSMHANVRVPPPRLEYLDYARDIELLNGMFGEENVYVVPMELLLKDFSAFKSKISKLVGIDENRISDSGLSRRNESQKISEFYFRYFINRWAIKSETAPKGLFDRKRYIARKFQNGAYRFSEFLPEVPIKSSIVERHKAAIREIVGNFFDESNRKASELLDIDLSQYGYSV